jgi:hypothetical protein
MVGMWKHRSTHNVRRVTGVPNAYWLTEIADPVEDCHRLLDGVQVTDFVEPFWYLNIDAQQDNMNLVAYDGARSYGFSCAAITRAFPDAGGGTRTPDTRIMIPLL